MWIKEKTIECPFCKGFLKNTDRSIYYNLDRSKPSDSSIASDGCGWAIITSNFYDYAMCPKCRNVFNIQTGNNGKSTEFKNYEKSVWLLKRFLDNLFVLVGCKKKIDIEQKEVIRDGFEFYEKAINVVEKSDDARYLILFEYIWRIERMEKDEKVSHLVNYNEAISEILEMLERRNKKTFDLESDSIKDIEKSIYITELLLMAELYRRRGMFDRAIAVLNKYMPKLRGYFKEFASEISDRSKKKIIEMFYLEINRGKENEKVVVTSAQ